MPLGYTVPRGRLIVTAMRHKTLLVLGFVLLVLVMACGGTPTPLTPEEALTKRAEASKVEFNRGD